MVNTQAGRTNVEINPKVPVLVVWRYKQLLVPHLACKGGEGEDQLVNPKALVETVQKVTAVSLEFLDPDEERLDQGVLGEPGSC